MPAFKYTATANVPSQISGRRAQARSVSAPQLRPPVNRPQTITQVPEQKFFEQPKDQTVSQVARGAVVLGEIYFRRSAQIADEQATIEASEALSQYRRAVSDRFYSEKNGLWNITGREGSKLVSTYGPEMEELRDQYGASLSPAALQKYSIHAQGYHNGYMDQLGKRQIAAQNAWRENTKTLTEGADAGDIASYLEPRPGSKELNFEAISNIIKQGDPLVTDPLAREQREDRMIAQTLATAAAQRMDPALYERLADHLTELASPELRSKLPDAVDGYKKARADERNREITAQNKEMTKLRFKQDQDFSSLFRAGKLTRMMVDGSNLSGTRKEYYHNKLDGIKDEGEQAFLESFNVRAARGTFTYELMVTAIENGYDPDAMEDLYDRSEKFKGYKTDPKKNPKLDSALEIWKAMDFMYKAEKDPEDRLTKILAYYDLKAQLHDLAESGEDPLAWINTQQANEGNTFVAGLMGKEKTAETVRPQAVPEYSDAEMQILELVKDKYLQDTGGGDYWSETTDARKEQDIQDVIIMMTEDEIRESGIVGESDLRHLNLAEAEATAELRVMGMEYDEQNRDVIALDNYVRLIDEAIREEPEEVDRRKTVKFLEDNDVDLTRLSPASRDWLATEEEIPEHDVFAPLGITREDVPEQPARTQRPRLKGAALRERRRLLRMLREHRYNTGEF